MKNISKKPQNIQTRLVWLEGTLPIENCDRSPLWDPYNNAPTEPSVSIGSQKFESTMGAFDDQAADDFVIGNGSDSVTAWTTCLRCI